MDKTDKNTIEELLPRYCEGLATEEERLQVEMWMDESEENRRMAKQIHALYLATDTVHNNGEAILLLYFYQSYPYSYFIAFYYKTRETCGIPKPNLIFFQKIFVFL